VARQAAGGGAAGSKGGLKVVAASLSIARHSSPELHMLSWFDASEFKRFGEELAVLFMEDKPTADEGNRKDRRMRKSKGGVDDPAQVKLRKLVIRISAFEARKGANFYKKAKFANAFKWKLIEGGYDAAVADELAKELTIHFR
jgi:hypothetical protein